MKASLRQLAWVCVLLCGAVTGQAASYTVKPGDSLSKIARSQGCTVEALAKANGIKLSALIQAGQTLKLPGKAAAATPTGGSHVVQPGDTFSSISRQHGVSVESLQAANPDISPKALQPGQKILFAANAKPASPKPSSSLEVEKNTAEIPTPKPPAPAVTVEDKATAVASSQTEKATESSSDVPPSQVVEEKVRTVMVDAEMTFGEFATQHGADIKRLNKLNGLDLTAATVLAKGSELYVPVQAQADSQP